MLRVILLAVFLQAIACGCASQQQLQTSAIQAFDSGDGQTAASHLHNLAGKSKRPTLHLEIDAAIATLMAGQLRDSERQLQTLYDEVQYLRQQDLAEQTTAYLSDDRAITWSGREYERRMLDNLLTIASLCGNRTDAYAYSQRANQQTIDDWNQLTQNQGAEHMSQFQPNALAQYLYAAVQSENPMHQATAKQALKLVTTWAPQNRDEPAIIQTGFGTLAEQQTGVLHVISFTGRVTDWVNEPAAATSGALLIADQLLSAISDHELPPTIAPVQIAVPTDKQSRAFGKTVVQADGHTKIQSQTIVDLNAAASGSFEASRDQQIAKAIVRRIIKKGGIYAAKDQLDANANSPIDTILTVGGIVWEALEKADTRQLTLLPERIEVAHVPLSVGDHTITLFRSQNPEERKQVRINIQDARNSFLLLFCPNGRVGNTVGSDIIKHTQNNSKSR